jgi:hypothetical protein
VRGPVSLVERLKSRHHCRGGAAEEGGAQHGGGERGGWGEKGSAPSALFPRKSLPISWETKQITGERGADQRARAAVEQVPADAAVRERDGAAVGLRCRCARPFPSAAEAPGYDNTPWTINASPRCMAFAWGGSAARGCVRGGSVLKSSVFIVKRSERPDSFQSGVTVIQFSKSEGLFDHGRGGGGGVSTMESGRRRATGVNCHMRERNAPACRFAATSEVAGMALTRAYLGRPRPLSRGGGAVGRQLPFDRTQRQWEAGGNLKESSGRGGPLGGPP